MKIIELFSGIGGFTKGFEDAGYTIEEHYFSEIDKHAIANYKYNYPNAKYIGSVTDIRPGDFRGIDIITFGSPCQDFSLAGKRKSRESGLPTEQMLEINKEGFSNTLTSVQKDNVVIGTWRTHKDGNGFREIKENISPTIPARAREDGSGQPVINENAQIRRLTEIECERLQGFPDNFTEYGNYDGVIKKIPKTQRYKMLGNAVTVRVVEEIAKRLNLE